MLARPFVKLSELNANSLVPVGVDYLANHLMCVYLSAQAIIITSADAVALRNFSGIPRGTYNQDEPCINCRKSLSKPIARWMARKAAAKFAVSLYGIQRRFRKPTASWAHFLFRKRALQDA